VGLHYYTARRSPLKMNTYIQHRQRKSDEFFAKKMSYLYTVRRTTPSSFSWKRNERPRRAKSKGRRTYSFSIDVFVAENPNTRGWDASTRGQHKRVALDASRASRVSVIVYEDQHAWVNCTTWARTHAHTHTHTHNHTSVSRPWG